eukprot:1139245-Pelagomonas_calceolata.AAC.7
MSVVTPAGSKYCGGHHLQSFYSCVGTPTDEDGTSWGERRCVIAVDVSGAPYQRYAQHHHAVNIMLITSCVVDIVVQTSCWLRPPLQEIRALSLMQICVKLAGIKALKCFNAKQQGGSACA